MDQMKKRTAEQRRASAAKGWTTYRANREAEKKNRQDAITYANGLREQITQLESKLAKLKRADMMNDVSASLTGKALLSAEQIIQGSLPWGKSAGVYFLIYESEVVYVGQAVNVYSRIGQHTDKKFDRYAFVPCPPDMMNKIESLYIHCLRPKLNGNQLNGIKCAPISLKQLLG